MTTQTQPTPINRNRIQPGKCVAGLSGGYGFPRTEKPCLKDAWRPTARLCATHEALFRASQRPADKPLKDNVVKLPTGEQVKVHPKALAAYVSLMPEKPVKAAAKPKAAPKADAKPKADAHALSAFATPELAQKAAEKRAARNAGRKAAAK